MRAFEYGTRAAKAFAREQRRDNPAMRRPSRVESLRPTAIRQIFDDPRALTPTQSKCVRPSGYVKPVELARRRCGAKGRAKRRGMEAPRVKLAGGDTDYWVLEPVALFYGQVGVNTMAPHPNAAKLATNYLLSKEGQELYGKAMTQGSRRLDVNTAWLKEFGIQGCKDVMSVQDYLRVETHLESSVLKIRNPAIALATKLLK